MTNDTLKAALELAHKGRYVLPVGINKRPIIKDWPNSATKDAGQIKAWFSKSNFNLGVLTGAKSGFFCLDVDGEPGKESLHQLENLHGVVATETACMAITPSGGLHFYFVMPESLNLRNSAGKIAPGLDIRANGGYVVVPPSIAINRQGIKAAYEWFNPALTLSRCKLPAAPPWLINLLVPSDRPKELAKIRASHFSGASTAYGHSALMNECEKIRVAPQGSRNDTLNRCAFNVFRLVYGGEIANSDAETSLLNAAIQCGLEPKEIARTLNSARAKAGELPRQAPNNAELEIDSLEPESVSRIQHPAIMPKPPLEAFPPVIQQMLIQAAEAFKKVPVEVPIVAFLSLLSACVGRSRVVLVKDGWEEAGNLYLGIVAGSGLGKSPCFKAFLRPLWKHEVRNKARWDDLMKIYNQALEERRKIKEPDEMGPIPEKPIRPQHIVEDVTLEAIGAILADNPRGILWYSDELSSIILNLDRYSNAKGGTKSKLLSLYDGAPWKTSRRDNEKDQVIASATLSIVGTVQPRILKELFGQSDATSGFLPRFIFILAKRKQPAYLEEIIFGGRALLEKITDNLLGWEMVSSENEIVPRKIHLSRQAYEKFVYWHNQLMDNTWQESEAMQSIAAKLGAQVIRVALLLHCLDAALNDEDGTNDIKVEHLEKALLIGDWIIQHQRKVWLALDIEESPIKTPLDKAIVSTTLELEDYLRSNNWRINNDDFIPLVCAKAAGYDKSLIGRAAAKLGIKNVHTGRYRAKEFSEELIKNFKLNFYLQ